MGLRIAGKVVCGSLCILFLLLALIWIFPKDQEHILRAVVFAILSHTSATCYRYFEY